MKNMSIIVRSCRSFTERKLREYDLTFGEQIIVMFISAHENVNQDTISRTFMIDKGMVAKTLNKLEQKGYIVRRQNPDNKRENIVSLTQRGADVLIHMGTVYKEWNDILYEGMSEEEIAYVTKLTEKMAKNVARYLD